MLPFLAGSFKIYGIFSFSSSTPLVQVYTQSMHNVLLRSF